MANKGKDREPEIYATGNPEPIDKPKELPPEIDAERQAIAQELSEYIAAHPTDRALNHNSIRPLLDASHVLAFLSSFTDESVKMTGLRDPGEPFPLHYKGAAHVLTELFEPYCNGPDLADVVADCVKKYLATYPQPDTGQQDKGNKFTDLQLFADAETTPTLDEINTAESNLMDAQTAATAADISDLAKSAQAAAQSAIPDIDEMNQAARTLGNFTVRNIDNLDNPIDKINNSIWDSLKTDTGGQISFPIKAEPDSSKRQVNFLYAINFDNIESEVPIVKRLDPFDKRVYVAVGGLVKNGYYVFTTTQIYHAMGHTGKPGKFDKARIDKAMTKFHAIIYLSNQEEIEAGYNYPSHVYDGPLLPFYRDTELNKINGQVVESTYRVYLDEGKSQIPLIDFAAERKQVQTIKPEVFQVGLSDTDTNINIQDYLLERIAKARTGHGQKKILLSTLYDRTHLTTYKQKQRAPAKIKKCLDHYKDCDLIADYTMDSKCIVLSLSKK